MQLPWDIIIKRLKKEKLTNTEEVCFRQWMEADERNPSLFSRFDSLWFAILKERLHIKTDPSALWLQMEDRIKKTSGMITLKTHTFYRSVAATGLFFLVLLFVSGFLIIKLYGAESTKLSYNSLSGKSQIFLPDGTEVWLNAGSSLNYSTSLFGKTRKVDLIGEAFFNVRRIENKPFVVSCKGLEIKVYGTQFNVDSKSVNEVVNVNLITGSVVVESNSVSQQMLPGEEAVYSPKTGIINITENDVCFSAMWAHKSISFERKSLKELVKYLSKWYGVTIVMDPGISNNQAYTFTIKNEPLEEILRLMSRINPINYSFDEDNNVKINSNLN